MLRTGDQQTPFLIDVPRLYQPDYVSCGPTALRQVLNAYGDPRSPEEISAVVRANPDGGTLPVYLGLAAIEFGYRVRLYPFNLRIFDPTWFSLPTRQIRWKLRQRERSMRGEGLKREIRAWREFLLAGGELCFEELSRGLIIQILRRNHPVLCGLSATHLYQQVRERRRDNVCDDIRGEPVGHYVVVCGYRRGGGRFLVTDPWPHAPFTPGGHYEVPAQRLLNSILLGDATYDAVLVEVFRPSKRPRVYETK
jgi:hypothetical protein